MGFVEKMVEKEERLIKENTRKEFLKTGSTERMEMQQLTAHNTLGKGYMAARALFWGKVANKSAVGLVPLREVAHRL